MGAEIPEREKRRKHQKGGPISHPEKGRFHKKKKKKILGSIQNTNFASGDKDREGRFSFLSSSEKTESEKSRMETGLILK